MSEGSTSGGPTKAPDGSGDAALAPESVPVLDFEAIATETSGEFRLRLLGRGVLPALLLSVASCLLKMACMLPTA